MAMRSSVRRAVALMLGSATVWAAVPVFFSVGADTDVDPLWCAALVNGAGVVLAVGCFAAQVRSRVRARAIAAALRESVSAPCRLLVLLLDGAAIAASNIAFVTALRFDVDATVTVVVESWPLLAAFLLTGFVTRFPRMTTRQGACGLVAVVGIAVMLAGRGQQIGQNVPVAPLLAAVVAALTQALGVAAHQRLVQGLPSDLGAAPTFLVQAVRMAIAALVSVVVAIATTRALVLSPDVWLPVFAAAAAIVASTLLHVMSLRAAESAAVALLWFLTPVISIGLLVLAGTATATVGMAIGAALVVGANVAAQRPTRRSISPRSPHRGGGVTGGKSHFSHDRPYRGVADRARKRCCRAAAPAASVHDVAPRLARRRAGAGGVVRGVRADDAGALGRVGAAGP